MRAGPQLYLQACGRAVQTQSRVADGVPDRDSPILHPAATRSRRSSTAYPRALGDKHEMDKTGPDRADTFKRRLCSWGLDQRDPDLVDVTGTWEGSFRFTSAYSSKERPVRWVLQQNGAKVKGDMHALDGAPPIASIEGLVNGEVFSWTASGLAAARPHAPRHGGEFALTQAAGRDASTLSWWAR
jgi:hypothetical protein